jgi:hypothetical protein
MTIATAKSDRHPKIAGATVVRPQQTDHDPAISEAEAVLLTIPLMLLWPPRGRQEMGRPLSDAQWTERPCFDGSFGVRSSRHPWAGYPPMRLHRLQATTDRTSVT